MENFNTTKDTNPKIEALGANFEKWFAQVDFAAKVPVLYTATTKDYMSSQEILKATNPGEVTLADIYHSIDNLDTKSSHLFFVRDVNANLRSVFCFQIDGGWRFVSREIENTDPWYAGTTIHSSTQI